MPKKPASHNRIPTLPPRQRTAHKGDFGRILVIGGSRGMIGAPALVANAALRSGAGLVTVAAPKSIQPFVATLCPCATSLALPESAQGIINPHGVRRELQTAQLLDSRLAPDVIAAGPGLGRGDSAFDASLSTIWQRYLNETVTSLVLDADAINALTLPDAKSSAPYLRRTVITPHPGELARLLQLPVSQIQAAREQRAMQAAQRLSPPKCSSDDRCIVVLKGAGTVVTDGHRHCINKTGNPGMATGGSGDVLTGIIAALIAQGLPRFDAAILGVHVHGLAGDLAARKFGQVSLIASDLIDLLPQAFLRLHK